MTDEDFDAALLAAAFDRIATDGWAGCSVAAAARDAGLDLARARQRMGSRAAMLLRFGQIADHAALTEDPPAEGAPLPTVQERLFDMVMRRLDVLQTHRAGVIALLRGLPRDPATALMLGAASLASMGWLLEAASVPTAGPFGALRAKGMLAVWVWTVRSWMTDDSPDLSTTMATLDAALARAAQIARSLPGASGG